MERVTAVVTLDTIEEWDKLVVTPNMKHFFDKASGGKYVRIAKGYFFEKMSSNTMEAVEMRLFFFLNLKTIVISVKQPAELLQKMAAWRIGYELSAPTRALEQAVAKMGNYCKMAKMTEGEVVTAGAFIQAFGDMFKDVTSSILYVTPGAPEAVYAYGPYMCMDADAAINACSQRFIICLNLYNDIAARVKFDYKTLDVNVKGGNKEKLVELGRLILAENKKNPEKPILPTKQMVDAAPKTLLKNVDLTNMVDLVRGSYMITFLYALQAQTFRMKKQTAAQLAEVRKLVDGVLKATGYPVPNGKINFKDQTTQWFKDYHLGARRLATVARTVRRCVNGGSAGVEGNTGPKKDYSDFSA